jgi:hypothetical protein
MGFDPVDFTEWRRAVTDERDKALQRQRQSRNEEMTKKGEKSKTEEAPASDDYWGSKIRKYRDLPDEKLVEKEHKQKSKSTRSNVATSTAAIIAVPSGLASTVVHGGIMVNKLDKYDKSKTKEELLTNERSSRRLQPKKRTGSDILKDVVSGVVDGGLPGVAGAALDKLPVFK